MDNVLRSIVEEAVGEIQDDNILKNQVNNCVGLFLDKSIDPDHRPNRLVKEAYFVRMATNKDHLDLNYAFTDMHYAYILSEFLKKKVKEHNRGSEIFIKPVTVKGTLTEVRSGVDKKKMVILTTDGHYFNIIDWCPSSTMRAYVTLKPEQEKELVPHQDRVSLQIYKYLTTYGEK